MTVKNSGKNHVIIATRQLLAQSNQEDWFKIGCHTTPLPISLCLVRDDKDLGES